MVRPGKQTVTISTIAQKLGISASTVSYVLNGHAEKKKISPQTAKQVMEAARQMRYIPNTLARSLQQKRSGLIGFVVGNTHFAWAERLLLGMNRVFDPVDYLPVLTMHWWDAKRERRELISLLQRQVEAIICVPNYDNEDNYELVTQQGVPLLFIYDMPQQSTGISYVAWDAGTATRHAVEHLIATGCRRIGFYGSNFPMDMVQRRIEAYRQTLQDHGLPFNPDWFMLEHVNPPEAYYDMQQYVERLFGPGTDPATRPDALYFAYDALALNGLNYLRRAGVRVPEDVAVIGMGDLVISGHANMDLTTMREPTEDVGQLAAETVLQMIENPQEPPVTRLLEHNELVQRSTTRAPLGV